MQVFSSDLGIERGAQEVSQGQQRPTHPPTSRQAWSRQGTEELPVVCMGVEQKAFKVLDWSLCLTPVMRDLGAFLSLCMVGCQEGR